jgi:hypothetical protein
VQRKDDKERDGRSVIVRREKRKYGAQKKRGDEGMRTSVHGWYRYDLDENIKG